MKGNQIKVRGIGALSGLICAGLCVAGLAAYVIYGVTYDYLDAVVVLSILLGGVCALGEALKGEKTLGLLCLLSSGCLSYGIGLFFVNSFPVWADNLNNITMYASRGGLAPVIAILVILMLAIAVDVVACLTNKGGEKA